MKFTTLKCSFFGNVLCAIILCNNLGLNHKSSLYNPWFHCYPRISKKKKKKTKQKHTTNFLQIINYAPTHFLKNSVYIKSTEIIAQPSFSRNRLICRRIYKSLNIITFARGWIIDPFTPWFHISYVFLASHYTWIFKK